MNKSVYSLLAAAALVGAGTVPAHAAGDGDEGVASAAVLKAKLDVSLLGRTADVPLRTELNAVQAPGDAEETVLTAEVEGAEGGRPVTMLRADVATSKATADEEGAEGYSNLVNARVHVPGLPLLSVVEVEKATSKALCAAGREPVAESNVLGTVKALGKRVTLSSSGTTEVDVPGVGTVTLSLSETATTSRTAAATALALDVSVDPGTLGVAAVEGRVTLVEATCETPGGGDTGAGTSGGGDTGAGTSGGAEDEGGTAGVSTGGGNEPRPQTGSDRSGDDTGANLAETGGDSSTPYVAGGALALVAAGGALLFMRRRRA